MIKRFYFVRHGESESNATKILIGPANKLTEKGKEQSYFLEKRFTNIPLDAIVASPFVRTKETAALFNKTLKKRVTFSDLIVEYRYPKEMYGLHVDNPERTAILKAMIKLQRQSFDLRYSDEETLGELRDRATQALKYLKSLPHDRLAVITHGTFLKMLVAVIIHSDGAGAQTYRETITALKTTNTGITVCEYVKQNDQWTLLTWNDHAHLR